MPEVHLTINGRSYPVACEEGQESRIKELAQYLDRNAHFLRDIEDRLGQGDPRSDRLFDCFGLLKYLPEHEVGKLSCRTQHSVLSTAI